MIHAPSAVVLVLAPLVLFWLLDRLSKGGAPVSPDGGPLTGGDIDMRWYTAARRFPWWQRVLLLPMPMHTTSAEAGTIRYKLWHGRIYIHDITLGRP